MPPYVFDGDNVKDFFSKESGNHTWQRVPPTEKKGRTHTSIITIAVVNNYCISEYAINKTDVKRIYTMGSGPGGQHRNRTYSCVILKHKPTGIQAKAENNRSQKKNEKMAWKELKIRLSDYYYKKELASMSDDRFEQIGLGKRGNKKRTYNVKTNRVVDHESNRKASLEKVLKGNIQLLH